MGAFGPPGMGPGFYTPGMTSGDGAGVTGVTAAAVLTDNAVVVGDGGVRGVKTLGALGAAGTVLMSNGAGTPPSFQSLTTYDTEFDASIGASGADYTTVSAALAAGKSRLLAIDTVTETSNCAIPAAGLYIYILKGVTLNMGDFQFTCAAARRLSIVGQDQSATLAYAFSSEKYLVNGSTFANHIIFNTLTITNTSAVEDCYLVDGSSGNDGTELYQNLKLNLPNFRDSGIHFWSDNGIAENIHLVGGGTSCSQGITNSGANQQVNNIRISGTWIASASGAAVIITGGTFDGVYLDHAGDTSITVASGCGSNIFLNANGSMTTTVVNVNANVQLSNVNLNGPGSGTRTIAVGGSDSSISNFFAPTLTIENTRTDLQLTNGQVTSAVTFNGDRGCATNVKFIGGVTVPSGQDNNGFINCQGGADAGGGALTITVEAGANNTRVVGCMTDVAISDAGTGSVLLGNTIY